MDDKKQSLNFKKTVNFGVIGCGWVARDYGVPAIMEAENARLIAACDSNQANLSSLAESESLRRTSNLEDFLCTENLDAVYIATPNDSHRFLTEACASAGIHVLCEKPMATNFVDAEAMTRVCAENGVQYATAFDQRFQARHLRLRSLIKSGALGVISAIKIHYACWLPADWCADNWRVDEQRAGGGAFIDLAPHGIDLAQMMIDESLVDFACFFQTAIHDYVVDDGAVAIGKFAGGALFSLNVAYNCPDAYPRRTLEIIGSKKMAIATNTMGQTPGGELILIDKNGRREEIHIDEAEDYSPFRRQIEAFSECLLEGKPFTFDPANDLKNMQIIESAMRNGSWKISEQKTFGKNRSA
jgi:1,5-anhydro-D-fructose reductase (1,5-anhydro-D-mannitol-forming)